MKGSAMNSNWMRPAATAFAATLVLTGSAYAEDYKIAGPFAHENLAVYFVHGASQPGPVPMTLQDAAVKNLIGVTETRKVNQLTVENRGDAEIFLQAGEIVKGGDQDRVVGVSVILPPHSGPMPIVAFCIESGRWSARAGENHETFRAGARSVPPTTAKQFESRATSAYLGALIEAPARAAPPPATPKDQSQPADVPQAAPSPEASAAERERAEGALRRWLAEISRAQSLTWSEASRTQAQLSQRLRTSVANPKSPTSLALTLDDEHLRAAEDGFVAALQSHGMKDTDVQGYVLVVDGRIDSAQIYSSNELFRKMWPQSLRAGADEAIAAEHSNNDVLPSVDEVRAFLVETKGETARTVAPNQVQEVSNEPGKTVIKTGRASGAWIERSYHAQH
jgi:hypothetical protein